MRTELVRIGNSRGIRIPKPIIEQCGLGNMVELRVENDCLVISSPHKPRQGWEQAFLAGGTAAHDKLLPETPARNDFDLREWQW
jgi:antitoxin MazE